MNTSLFTDFVVVKPDQTSKIESADPMLYERLETDYKGFKGCQLVSCYEFEKDWDIWEMHPKGDEIVVLMSGKASLFFETDTDTSEMLLSKPGDFSIVPKNTWHTAKIFTPSRLMFITPGEGTQTKKVIT
uniref:cupin domain-containing protein n=1 Tax=Ningiella ruwaisensis TaxID=2364274 RepID=UPI00109F7951|nr:cupin domain-containing protein [Ningiella ruwaisensis]